MELHEHRVAGIAGGVGTTVLATLLGATDQGRELAGATIVVARNDFRCAKALVEASVPMDTHIVMIMEPGRSLTDADVESCIGRRLVRWELNPSLARADDAGLLNLDRCRRHLAHLIGCLD